MKLTALTITCLCAIGCAQQQDAERGVKTGATCKVVGSDVVVVVQRFLGNLDGQGVVYECRVDNGQGLSPRFSVVRFFSHELTAVTQPLEK